MGKWDAYSAAIDETMRISHFPYARWTTILSDDKPRARIAAIQTLLSAVDYKGKDEKVIGKIDPLICGGPGLRQRM